MHKFPKIELSKPNADGQCALRFKPATSSAEGALFLSRSHESGETIVHQVLTVWIEDYEAAKPKWLPISSARKDGTSILVIVENTSANSTFTNHRAVHLASWNDIQGWLQAGSCEELENQYYHVTHWQPEPELPSRDLGDRE